MLQPQKSSLWIFGSNKLAYLDISGCGETGTTGFSFFFFLKFLLACLGPEDESTLEAVGSVISGSSNPQRQACSALDSRSKVAEEGSDVLSPLVVALDDVLHLQGERAASGGVREDEAREAEHCKGLRVVGGRTDVMRSSRRRRFEVLRESLSGRSESQARPFSRKI